MSYESERIAVIEAVRKACAVVVKVQAGLVSEETISKKDKSPVTVGDYAAQAIIINELTKFNYPFIAEEESKTLSQQPEVLKKVLGFAQTVDKDMDEKTLCTLLNKGSTEKCEGLWWAIDPIDGTSGFLRRDQYAVCVALMKGSVPVLGVLGCPALPLSLKDEQSPIGCILAAATGGGAYQYSLTDFDIKKGQKITVTDTKEASGAVFTESQVVRGYARELNEGIYSELKVSKDSLKMDSQCKYAMVARGESDVYLRLSGLTYKECVWDHAAGCVIIAEAGGKVTDFKGEVLDFAAGRKLTNNIGILCSNANLYEPIFAAIKKVNPLDIFSEKK